MLNCMKCFLIGATFTMIFGCRDSDVAHVHDHATTAATSTRQQYDAFSFEVPSGWSNVTPDRDKTKAIVLLGGTNWHNAKAMIKVDVGTPAFPTPQEMAGNFAKDVAGQVAPVTLDYDGETATKVITSSTSMATPREMIIIYRDGKAYLIMAGAIKGVDPTNAMELIRSTWKWKD